MYHPNDCCSNPRELWSDWPGILAETIRAVLESNCNPVALKDARYNLAAYDEQEKAVRERGNTVASIERKL